MQRRIGKLVVVLALAGLGWMVVRWAGSRRRRALDRQPPGSVPVTRQQGVAPAPVEPLDGEPVESVGSVAAGDA